MKTMSLNILKVVSTLSKDTILTTVYKTHQWMLKQNGKPSGQMEYPHSLKLFPWDYLPFSKWKIVNFVNRKPTGTTITKW